LIELILLFFWGLTVEPEIQTVYNFDIYSGEKVAPSALTQKILDNRKKSTEDYSVKIRSNFYIVSDLPIFDPGFKITYYEYDSDYGFNDEHEGYKVESEYYPFRNIYNYQYPWYR